MPKEPESTVVPETEWDKTPMVYAEAKPTDEDGNLIESSGKSASGDKRGAAADSKEK